MFKYAYVFIAFSEYIVDTPMIIINMKKKTVISFRTGLKFALILGNVRNTKAKNLS